MKAKSLLISVTLVLCVTALSCKKKHDPIYGTVVVHGMVKDDVSGAPLPHATIQVTKYARIYNLFGYSVVQEGIAATTSADSNGIYSLSYEARGEYELSLEAIPADSLHVPSNVVSVENDHIKAAGTYDQHFHCCRCAWAKMWVYNKRQSKEAANLTFYVAKLSAADKVMLDNFNRDTIVYLKLAGNENFTNYIQFDIDGRTDSTFKAVAGPWDTVYLMTYY